MQCETVCCKAFTLYKRTIEAASTEVRIVKRRTGRNNSTKGVLGTAVLTFRKMMEKCQRRASGFLKECNASPSYTQKINPALLLL